MHINWAHIHLMINHFPVVGVLGVDILVIYGLIRRKNDFVVFSFGFFIAIAIIAGIVFLTGEGAEDVVKHLPGVTEALIGRHEESAEFSLTGMSILGAVGIVGLYFDRKASGIPRWLIITALLFSLATSVMVGVTANLGGQIRHTEIR